MCEHHYHYLGTELHRLSPERDREDGGVRTEERESVPRRVSLCPMRDSTDTGWLGIKHPASLDTPRCFSLKQGPKVLWIEMTLTFSQHSTLSI